MRTPADFVPFCLACQRRCTNAIAELFRFLLYKTVMIMRALFFGFNILIPMLAVWYVVAVLAFERADGAPTSEQAYATTLRGKTILGYQGWFSCPDDQTGSRNWGHWINADGSPAVDILPDTTEFPQQAGCVASFIRDQQGKPIMLYSSQNMQTVDVQFKWLRDNGISGVALQRFVNELSVSSLKQGRDQVLKNVRLASEHNNRVFFVTYDITGAGPDWYENIKQDWRSLIVSQAVDSPAYLYHDGKRVVEIWGMGWHDRPATPSQALTLMQFFANNSNINLRASVILGVPLTWRDMTEHSGDTPSWRDVYQLASVISPWSIGGFRSEDEEFALINTRIKADILLTQANRQIYLPVVFPGFSSFNQSHGQQTFEFRPRACGKFLKMQVKSLLQLGIDSLYVAMFDEGNEGTAVYKSRLDPLFSKAARFIEADHGCAREEDLYLRLIGEFTRLISVAPE